MPGSLILVGTPIGNLGDLSSRAQQALRDADFIAAEDTRVTAKLLNHFNIKKPMISYYEHNSQFRGEQIVTQLLSGQVCALVTDAGMPAISDPGEPLVRRCREQGIAVTVIPGPSALIAALSVSGLPSGRFCFEGFLSMNRKNRRLHLDSLREEQRTIIFYEAPHKLAATLNDLYDALGDRRIALARELTKLHEETVVTTLSYAVEQVTQTPPRGEYVLVIEGASPVCEPQSTLEEAIEIAKELIDCQSLSASMAAKTAAAQTGLKKGDIYKGLMT